MESHLHTLKESQRYKAGRGTPVTELGKQSLLSSRAVQENQSLSTVGWQHAVTTCSGRGLSS